VVVGAKLLPRRASAEDASDRQRRPREDSTVHERSSLRHVVAVVAGIAIGSLLVGSAAAITDTSFQYTHPKTGYLNVSSMAFAPDSLQGATDDYFNTWNESLTNQAAGRCFNAGVSLPQGATMTKITFYYRSDATSDLGGYLVRRNPANGSGKYVVTVAPTDDLDANSSVTASIPLAYRTVNNKTFAYGVGVCMDTEGTRFDGVRVTYLYTTAGS
jgi:hypothetical protein